MEQVRGKPRQRRKEARPGEILEAAFEEFARNGFAATRLDDVASRAGITKGTIYTYFPSKEDLFAATVRDTFKPTMENIAALMTAPTGPAMEILHSHFRFSYAHIVQNRRGPDLLRILVAEASRFPDLVERWNQDVFAPLNERFIALVRYGIARGEFRNVDLETLPHLAAAPVMMASTWRILFDDRHAFDLDAYIEGHLDMLGRLLLSPPGSGDK